MILFIGPNTFGQVGKFHGFRNEFLGTLGDALTAEKRLFGWILTAEG